MPVLILLRHGQSTWNLENRFTGEVDVDLSELGEAEAGKAGLLLKNYPIDEAFTSVLKRAIHTLDIVLKIIGRTIPVTQSAALNERHYGDLQGLNKAETEQKFGAEQVLSWRRSYDAVPPNGESLKNTYDRVVPYYQQAIEPRLKAGKNILIVAHGNSLRALMMYLEEIDGKAIAEVNIATGIPRVYQFQPRTAPGRGSLPVKSNFPSKPVNLARYFDLGVTLRFRNRLTFAWQQCCCHVKTKKMKKIIMIALLVLAGNLGIAQAQKPAVVLSHKAGWHKIGETTVSFEKERDEIFVVGANRFSAIQFKVLNEPIDLTDLEVYYDSGDKQDIAVNMTLQPKAESRVIELNGGERTLKRVVLVYKTLPNHNDKKAHVEIWGLKNNPDRK